MAKGGDCKSPALRLRRFESYLSHHSGGNRRVAAVNLWCFDAGVAQWQSKSFPNSRRGFDSLHPLQSRFPDRFPQLRVSDFDFVLPPERIALRPAEPRESAKLLVVGDQFRDLAVADLPSRSEERRVGKECA